MAEYAHEHDEQPVLVATIPRLRVSGYGRSIAVTREGLEAIEHERQTTAKARWKRRHRRERIARRIWSVILSA